MMQHWHKNMLAGSARASNSLVTAASTRAAENHLGASSAQPQSRDATIMRASAPSCVETGLDAHVEGT